MLVLADGRVPSLSASNDCRIDMMVAETVQDVLGSPLTPGVRTRRRKTVQHDCEKWLKYFLSPSEIAFMRALRADAGVACLAEHAHIDIGVVTGDNSFFVLTQAEAESLGIEEYTVPLIGRSQQLEGAVVSADDWGRLASQGSKVLLFHANGEQGRGLSRAARAYIASGEARGANKGYKCSIRSLWYSVPAIWSPDCLLFRQIHDFPRVVLNLVKAVSTDTIHRMRCKTEPERLVPNLYTHLTAASAEIEGRSYGGGVLELEPTEAERLLVPSQLHPAMPVWEIDRLVRAGKLDVVLRENDRLVLMAGLGLSRSDCQKLRRIWRKMRDRRHSRRRNQTHAGRCGGIPAYREEYARST